jgi:hypothetical protein
MSDHYLNVPIGRIAAPDSALAQALDPRATAQPAAPERVDAPPLASAERILDLFKEEVALRGVVGEERNAAILYLVFTSRLLKKQASAGLKGHSSSGKSFTVETVMQFFPEGEIIEFTAISEKALIYSDRDFRHKTIVIYEVVALREGNDDDMTSYLLRSLLSEGQIRYDVTERKNGEFGTREIVKEGPVNLVFTTTKTQVHAENETRVLSLNTDDSSEQTGRVLLEIARDRADASGLDEWKQLQQWLTQQERSDVAIPFAESLALEIPPVAVRLRRDFSTLLALIRAHALLHRMSRAKDPTGRVVATLDDYREVRALVIDALSAGVGAAVAATVRQTVETVVSLNGGSDEGVSAMAVAGCLGIDKSNASRRLKAAADGGYIVNREDRRGKAARWVPGEPLPDDRVLLPAAEVIAERCAVARDFQRNESTQPLNGRDAHGASSAATVVPDSDEWPECTRCGARGVRLVPHHDGSGSFCPSCCVVLAGEMTP